MSLTVPAVPEFADQYLQVSHDVIRPKPRRLDMSRPEMTSTPPPRTQTPKVGTKDCCVPRVGGVQSPPVPLRRPVTLLQGGKERPLPSRSRDLHTPSPGFCLKMTHAKSSPGLFMASTNSSRHLPGVPADSFCLSEEDEDEEDEGVVGDGHLSRDSSHTDCGSLSKSSSDGDPVVVCRRRTPGRHLKGRRRSVLSFPLHAEEIRRTPRTPQECFYSSSDDNRSSGHASMSEASCVSPVTPPGVLSRVRTRCQDLSQSDDPGSEGLRGTPLKSVPEDDRSLAPSSAPSQGVKGGGLRRSSAAGPPPSQVLSSSSSSSAASPSRRRCRGFVQEEGFEGGVEDLRLALEQLRSSHSFRTNYSTSTYSSVSESEPSKQRRLLRHSSLETLNTSVTTNDEFVWIDSHQRLVELQNAPWTNRDVLRVLQSGRLREQLGRVSMEAVPRLSYLLQRPLVRLAREAQRCSRSLGMCSKREIGAALRVVLSPALADSCIKACHRAAAIYAVSRGDAPPRQQSKSARAGLQLSVGRFHRWMCDVKMGGFVHEYAAVYLASALENLLEEVVGQCLPEGQQLSAAVLESRVAANPDLWGILQPFSHLSAGRTATGALSLPSWPSPSSISDGNGTVPSSPSTSGTSPCLLTTSASSLSSAKGCPLQSSQPPEDRPAPKATEQSLLTTCVGSIHQLGDLLSRVVQYYNYELGSWCGGRSGASWGPGALHALYYFMRCSQLEHADHVVHRSPVQELMYERPYLVLPPLVEWVRVATAHAEHRCSQVVDKDDVMQAARLLLPGVDCPLRFMGSYDEKLYGGRHQQLEDSECARLLKTDLAFRMLTCGRTDLVGHALQLLPPGRGVNTLNEQGLTPLMLACMRGDEAMVHILMDAGADVDVESPPPSNQHPSVNPETQHWTALTHATTHGYLAIVKLLLEKGANVEGGARLSEDKITETPLQLAAASGKLDLVSLLLFYGAHPYLSTMLKDCLSYGGAAQRGCYSAMAVAAAHGQRAVLHKLLAHPVSKSSKEVLSLEDFLAEGASQLTSDRRHNRIQQSSGVNGGVPHEDGGRGAGSSLSSSPSSSPPEPSMQVLKLSKPQLKALQEAMYHSAENGHLDITLDLRNIGVPWTLHCWMHTLATANELRLESAIDQLLQDFLQVWPEDCSSQFVDECLPLLTSIFRHSKNEGTTLLLADIFSCCFGKEPVKPISHVSIVGGTRIDPRYVNSPEMSDVQFCVEGRSFYAHKIILVNASPRFRALLTAPTSEGGSPPVVQITDIRYHIFQLVMEYLYKGGCEGFDIEQNDILELMAAAHFFQVDGLVHLCESRCSRLVASDNVVSIYVHAKAYSAVQLLEYCQGFLLQNMVSLLTYDDNVRKLIFGKRLLNHDVLSGLLLSLQARVKQCCKPTPVTKN